MGDTSTTIPVPAGDLAAFGTLMERAETALAAETQRALAAETALADLGRRLDGEIAEAVSAERERILALAESRKTTLRWPENGPGLWGEIDVVPLAALRDPGATATCGQCDNGLVGTGACTCGTGGDVYGHESLCGAGPCPNGCWERLHPPAVQP